MKHLFLVTVLALLQSTSAFAQIEDIVKTEGIASDLHRNSIGKIYFTSHEIELSHLKSSDIKSDYTLTNKSNLYFIAFMGNSITNYLHRLSPALPADSLTKFGNYQITLFVDGRLVYQSNLYPGAPYAKIQDIATVINKPLINNGNSNGIWSESFWNRFMKSGGDSALTEGRHLLRMEIRPYLKAGNIIVGNLIASGSLNLVVNLKPFIDVAGIRLNKLKPYPGFKISKEKFDTEKIKELKGSINAGIFKKINSIIVIKNGKLLVEEYFNGENRNTLHDPRSVGKSFASTITGIAIGEKYLKNENQSLKDFYDLHTFKNFSNIKENVTLKDLLTMSSAFDGDDEDVRSPGTEDNMDQTQDWVKFTLDLPIKKDTVNKDWHYFTAGVILLGDILQRNVPGGLQKYADDKLFKTLGISKYKWEYTPQQVPNTAGGIQMNALDFAKYGQLYKNDGIWNGKQIIPRDWVQKTLMKQKQIMDRKNEFYGYLFWNKSFSVASKMYEAYYCAGNGGNYIIVFKDLPLVIVVTASAYGQSYAHPQVTRIISEFVLPAVLK